MKKLIILLIFCLFTFLLSQEITLTKINGNVKIISEGTITKARIGQIIKETDTIKTYSDSFAVITLKDGTVKKIEPNNVISIGKLLGKADNNSLYNIFLKINRDPMVIENAPSVIAGVRGAEQGEKGKFGVVYDNESVEETDNVIVYERAEKAFNNQDYQNAIEFYNTYISTGTDNSKIIKSHYYKILSQIELLDYSSALQSISKIQSIKTESTLKNNVLYYQSLCYYMTEKDIEFEKSIQSYLTEAPNGKLIWETKSLYFAHLVKTGNKKEAKKIKDDILLNCNNNEIKNNINGIKL